MFSIVRRQLSVEVMFLALLGALVVGFAAFICVSAYNYRPVVAAPTNLAEAYPVPMALPEPEQTVTPDADGSRVEATTPENPTWSQPSEEVAPSPPAPLFPKPDRPVMRLSPRAL
jgi:hypothetical protein